MVSFQPTSGHLAKSIHLCLPGQPGVYTKLTRSKRDVRIACFWSVSFTNCCLTLHGGSIVRTQRVKMSFREDFSDLIILVSLTAVHLCQRVVILNMMTIALELALNNPVYEDIALKFFEHFLAIAAAMNNIADEGIRLWDEEDEFFYDVLHLPGDTYHPIKIRSLVGLIPLCAVEVLEPHVLDALPTFKYHLTWFLNYRPDLMRLVSHWQQPEAGERHLLALVRGHRMKRLLKRMLDSTEFLSDFGIRSMSKYHVAHPFELPVNGVSYSVQYEPAESHSELFGGNSNWRGPIWFPLNYLLIESLEKFYYYYGDDFKVECPTGSGKYLNLKEVADELSKRLIRLFLRDKTGRRSFNGDSHLSQRDPHFRDYLLFHEFFHGDNGIGLGASHQTGWTGLVAMLLQQTGILNEEDPKGISSVGHRQTVPLGYEPLERS